MKDETKYFLRLFPGDFKSARRTPESLMLTLETTFLAASCWDECDGEQTVKMTLSDVWWFFLVNNNKSMTFPKCW